MRNISASEPGMSGKEREHYLFLQKSFEDFSEAAIRMQTAFSNLEQKFNELNLELEHKNAALEKAAAEKEEVSSYLQNILESLTTGVVVTDLNGNITIMNRCAGLFTGTAPEAAIGTGLKCLFPDMAPADLKSILSHTPSAAPGKKIRINDRLIEIFNAPVRGKNGFLIGSVIILRDVTRIEKLEEIEKRNEKLAAMGELAANIAHEIRNPLGSIELFASLLMKEAKQKKELERLLQIIASVKNVDNKIRNLLLFAGNQQPHKRRISLHRVLREVLSFSQQFIENGGISLEARYAAAEPYISGDPEMLKQVFLNILLNAIQAMPDGGHLEIRTILGDATIEIRFSDTGGGIPSENLSKIFNPFFSTKEKGSGLGLAIVHTIIDIHDGSIDVESAGGQTVFSMTLPLSGKKSKSRKTHCGPAGMQVNG